MQVVSFRDSLHKMLNPLFEIGGKKRSGLLNLSPSMLKVTILYCFHVVHPSVRRCVRPGCWFFPNILKTQ